MTGPESLTTSHAKRTRRQGIARACRVSITAACVLAVLMVAASGQSQDPPAAEPVQVPFELLRSLHIAVEVKMGDAGPRRLIFDLGAPTNIVSGRFAAEAGLITEEAAKRKVFFGMRGEKVAKKFQVGELVAEDMPVMIMDHPTIQLISELLGPIDGIVGYPFFARYKFAIDYPAKTVTFLPGGDYKPRNVMQQMWGRMFGNRDEKKKLMSSAGLWGVDLLQPEGENATGVVVARVWPASPASTAGLQSGDRVLTIDGRWTDTPSEAVEAAAFAKPNEPVAVRVERDGMKLELQVTPALGI